jgi:hypothetical protein
MSKYIEIFIKCLLTCAVLSALVLLVRACVRYEPRYYYWLNTIDVVYTYENDTTKNHYVCKDWLVFMTPYDTLGVSYSCQAGYHKRAAITRHVKHEGKNIGSKELVLFVLPDKKVAVVDVTSTLSARKTSKGYPAETLNEQEN